RQDSLRHTGRGRTIVECVAIWTAHCVLSLIAGRFCSLGNGEPKQTCSPWGTGNTRGTAMNQASREQSRGWRYPLSCSRRGASRRAEAERIVVPAPEQYIENRWRRLVTYSFAGPIGFRKPEQAADPQGSD